MAGPVVGCYDYLLCAPWQYEENISNHNSKLSELFLAHRYIYFVYIIFVGGEGRGIYRPVRGWGVGKG